MIPNGQHRRRRLWNFACEKLRTVMLAKYAIYTGCPKCSVLYMDCAHAVVGLLNRACRRLHCHPYGNCISSLMDVSHQLWGSMSFCYKPTRGETAHEVIVAHSNHNDWNKCVNATCCSGRPKTMLRPAQSFPRSQSAWWCSQQMFMTDALLCARPSQSEFDPIGTWGKWRLKSP